MGCLKNFSIKTIQKHLKSKVSCQNFYSQTERDELKTQCDLYRKRKKTQYLVQYYKENKKVKRQPEEIETIIKIMKEIRESSFVQCLWIMADDLKSDVHILRKMKSYFRNQIHVEQDIEEFIHASFTYFNDEYDYEMKEIVWTLEFLLSNPSMSIDEEVKNLKSYLNSKLWDFDLKYKSQLFDLYFENLLKQLPEVTELNEGGSVRDYFEEIKIDNWSDKVLVKDYYEHEYDGLYYILDDAELENLPNNWLYPFLDPNLLHYDNFEDDFTSFLKTICRGCGKKFKNILQHLANPEVMCKKFYEKDEMEYLKHKSIVQKFTILLRDNSSKSPSKYLATEEETFTCKICDESFDDIKTLIKHINKRKKCQHTNMDEIKRLQIEYLRIKKVELISCLGCKKMFALNDIRVHFTNNKKIDCEQKYIDRNELETLNHKIREHITKTKRKINARTNAIHNPKRITKFMERKRIYLEYIRKHAGQKNSKI